MTVNQYTNDLKAILSEKISVDHSEEAVEETRGHLQDRTDEIMKTGVDRVDAENVAIQEFGPLDDIAKEFLDSFPPKPPFEARWLSRAFAGIAVIWVGLAAFIFFSMPPVKGLEAVAQMLVSNAPMLVVPGVFAGLSRVKYHRFRAARGVIVMATTGFAMAVIGGATLLVYRILGLSSNPELMPLFMGMLACSCAGYILMCNLNASGKALRVARRLIKLRG